MWRYRGRYQNPDRRRRGRRPIKPVSTGQTYAQWLANQPKVEPGSDSDAGWAFVFFTFLVLFMALAFVCSITPAIYTLR